MKTKIAQSKRLSIPGNGDSLSKRENFTTVLKLWMQKLSYYSMFTALPAVLTSFAQEAQAKEAKKPEVSVTGQTANILEKLNKNRNRAELLGRQGNNPLALQKSKYSNIISELAGGDNCPGNAIPSGTYTAAAPFTDSGNTTGANNTVKLLDFYYYNSTADGPDQIYSFTLTGRGANPKIEVSATSATYKPMIYILNSRFGGACPAGTNNSASNGYNPSFAPSPGGTATLDKQLLNTLPLNTPLYLFIDSERSGANDSGPYTLRMQDVGISPAPAPPSRTRFDFDGDGIADFSVFRPSNGVWYLTRPTPGFSGTQFGLVISATQFGLSTDKITPADFDGDGKTDIAVFRDGTWYWLNSSDNSFNAYQFGLPNDIPVPADYTIDGRAELAVYRGGIWYTLNLANNQFNVVHFGLPNDKPVVGDYDGDSRADYAVFRDGIWYLQQSSRGFAAIQFGFPTDRLVPEDYDGDGKTDVAVYRDGFWYWLNSSNGNFNAYQFGLATDVPVPADYDGDDIADLAVYRDGIWHLRQSSNFRFAAVQFGLTSDKPIPSAFLP